VDSNVIEHTLDDTAFEDQASLPLVWLSASSIRDIGQQGAERLHEGDACREHGLDHNGLPDTPDSMILPKTTSCTASFLSLTEPTAEVQN
jgi:hypothetical protein